MKLPFFGKKKKEPKIEESLKTQQVERKPIKLIKDEKRILIDRIASLTATYEKILSAKNTKIEEQDKLLGLQEKEVTSLNFSVVIYRFLLTVDHILWKKAYLSDFYWKNIMLGNLIIIEAVGFWLYFNVGVIFYSLFFALMKNEMLSGMFSFMIVILVYLSFKLVAIKKLMLEIGVGELQLKMNEIAYPSKEKVASTASGAVLKKKEEVG